MMRLRARVASAERHILGEGPLRVDARRVLWVDVVRGQVFIGELDGDRIRQTTRHEFPGTVGAAALSASGTLLVAEQEELIIVHPDGSRRRGPRVVPEGAARRTNDGAVDPGGRFLIGTLPLDDAVENETLLRIEAEGTITVIDDNLTLSNGLAWSPDGRILYSTDTAPGMIWKRSYDPDSGQTGVRREHLRFTDGFPDGITVDAEGHLWVAIWGAGEVRRFDPGGNVSGTVSVAAPHVSSVAFVGANCDRLLITTASRDLSADEIVHYPDAGRLFLADVPVQGLPATPWSASWFPES